MTRGDYVCGEIRKVGHSDPPSLPVKIGLRDTVTRGDYVYGEIRKVGHCNSRSLPVRIWALFVRRPFPVIHLYVMCGVPRWYIIMTQLFILILF